MFCNLFYLVAILVLITGVFWYCFLFKYIMLWNKLDSSVDQSVVCYFIFMLMLTNQIDWVVKRSSFNYIFSIITKGQACYAVVNI